MNARLAAFEQDKGSSSGGDPMFPKIQVCNCAHLCVCVFVCVRVCCRPRCIVSWENAMPRLNVL